jgi:phosphoribosylaminoimidazole carboxylase PurE protein
MRKPVVAVIMGSDSDLPVVKDAVSALAEFNVPYEVLILSAHRSPDATAKYAKNAGNQGIKVIIAAAGGAAHLAGVIAGHFPLPVIGIPIKTSTLNGVDSLYSIVQMPPGIPVATVGINAAKNAALLAVQILAVDDKRLVKEMIEYKNKLAQGVISKSKKIKEMGVEEYLKVFKK